jgi:PHD/YefM family antitoxin component YafN of YafNO toxin-antitoxin module
MLLLGKLALGAGSAALLAGGILCSEGFVRIDVRESQPEVHHVFVVAPAILARIGAHFVPKAKLQEASVQVRPWMPVIRAAITSLRDERDMTLVEVNDEQQQIVVKKNGGDIVVDIADENENVHMSVPLRAMESTIEVVADAGGDSGKS